MAKRVAFLFPGQGAQYPGMGRDFAESFAEAREVFEEADDLLHTSLSALIFEGPAERLTLTKHAQVAIYVASIALLRVLQKQFPALTPSVCAGLSLGEYTALTAAGKLPFQEGLPLVQVRAACMNEACERYPGTMQVVLGMEEAAIDALLLQSGLRSAVWVANLNCPGQVVIAGTKEGVGLAAEALKKAGAKRVLPLDVSGAFHSGLMQEAKEKLSPRIEQAFLRDSPVEIVMNVPGDYVSELGAVRQNMIEQVTSPVRWEKGVRAMVQKGIDAYVEIGCGKTLSGMHKRIGVEAPLVSVEKISDLETIHTLT